MLLLADWQRVLPEIFKFFESLVDRARTDLRHVWFVQQQPLCVSSFKNFEVAVKIRFEGLELSFRSHLLLDVVSRIHQVVQNLLANGFGLCVPVLTYELGDCVCLAKAAPHYDLKLTHM